MPRANDFAYAVSYVRALRSKLLSGEQYEVLLKAKDEQEMLRYLSDTAYSNYLLKRSGRTISLYDIDSVIFGDYYRIFRDLMSSRTTEHGRELLMTTYLRHEFSCLKNIMHQVMAGTSKESAKPIIPLGKYTPEYISVLLKSRDLRQLFTEIDDPQIRMIALPSVKECEETASTVPVEMAIDKFYMSSLWTVISRFENWDREPVKDIVGTEIDATNIGLILRGKRLGMPFLMLRDLVIPIKYKVDQQTDIAIEAATTLEAMQAFSTGYYGPLILDVMGECERQRTLFPLELALKRFIVQRCSRTFVGYPFSIGPLLAFLNLKYFEALDIRTILIGKKEKKSARALRRLLLSPLRES